MKEELLEVFCPKNNYAKPFLWETTFPIPSDLQVFQADVLAQVIVYAVHRALGFD